MTAVEWLVNELNPHIKTDWALFRSIRDTIEQAKAMEKEQIGYTEEQAKQIWKAGQEYWKTSGASITFEELIEKLKNK